MGEHDRGREHLEQPRPESGDGDDGLEMPILVIDSAERLHRAAEAADGPRRTGLADGPHERRPARAGR